MRLIGALLVFVGCHSGGAATPDSSVEPDGQPQRLGMFVGWEASPALPGALSDKLTVSDATFNVFYFQVVGDAGSDARTAHAKYPLAWRAGTTPGREAFYDAPAGVYSKVTLNLMGGSFGENAFQIQGTVRDNGMLKPFRIEDRMPLNIAFYFNRTTLMAAGSVSLAIQLDLRDAVNGINFKNVDEDDGVLEVHEGPELAGFRERLQHAFKVDD
jgi:hypothetical protein